jgi:putative tryptophan/tyrosine transport system substrate-binding protein
VRRREFIATLGSAAAWPLVARAEQIERQDKARRIGVLLGAVEERDPEAQARIAAFREGLEALGWIEGQNIHVDYRFGGGNADRIRADVIALVNSSPDLIVANSSAVLAELRRATSVIPVVFAVVNEPVGQGFVASLAHPGGNVTGFSLVEVEMVGKWMELLKQMAPSVRRTTLLFNPLTAPYYASVLRELGTIPAGLKIELVTATVQNKAEIEQVIASTASKPGNGLITGADSFIVANRAFIIGLANRYHIPAIYQFRQFAADGGLMSYGPDTADIFRRSASYVDRILKGVRPADLPVQEPTKFELAINLKTAKELGLDVPATLLARADEVIE